MADSRCLVCRGAGVVDDAGDEIPCACAHRAARNPNLPGTAGFVDFADIVADVRRITEEREAHKAACTARPCRLCSRHVCRCGKPFDGDDRDDCPDCIAAMRLKGALSRVIATIPQRFKWAASGDPAALQARVKLSAERIAKALESPPDGDLMLIGNTGAGKTSLAVAMLCAGVRQNPGLRSQDRFAAAYALAGARARHPLGQGEAPEIKAAMKAPLLLLDDLGSEADDRRNVLTDIIFARHEGDLPTWVTSGFPPEHLMGRYGSALIRRLIENRKPVELGK